MTDTDDPSIDYLMARYPTVKALADRIDELEAELDHWRIHGTDPL